MILRSLCEILRFLKKYLKKVMQNNMQAAKRKVNK